MRKNSFSLSSIESLAIVGILGLMLFVAAKSYRTHLISIEVNNSNSDFYNVAELIHRELLEIKKISDQQPNENLKFISQRLDSAQEWFELIEAKIDLKTQNVIITSIDGTIADENLIVEIGFRSKEFFLIKEKSICWDLTSLKCI